MIQWSQQYSVGIKTIDEQHQKFFATFNVLYEALLKGEAEETLTVALKSLSDYAEYHFDLEEQYFKKFAYAGAAEHIAQHDMFRSRIAELKRRYFSQEDQSTLADEVVDLLDNWLIKHILELDRKYVACFKEHGLGELQ